MTASKSPLLARGFKAKRGEKTIPVSIVRELLQDAYRSGAAEALKMAKEIDGGVQTKAG